MRHMKFLETVAAGDVKVLREKEATYQGSWKAAGGRSAWFMMRRNMDRLITMMRKPEDPVAWNMQNVDDTITAISEAQPSPRAGESYVSLPGTHEATTGMLQHLRDCYVSENIFAKIRENVSGEDGTVLACLRDLRRYLVLIEAEMMSRGVVAFSALTPSDALRFSQQHDAISSEVLDSQPKRTVPRMSTMDQLHLSPPWLILSQSIETHPEISPFYKQITPLTCILEPVVDGAIACPFDVYLMLTTRWVIKMEEVPTEMRGFYPRVQQEMNAKEYEESRHQFLYAFSEMGQKYVLLPSFAAWGRDA